MSPEMVFIEGSSFKMGDTYGNGQGDELPIRDIQLDDYYIAKTEVTVLQWRQYCRSKNIAMPSEPDWGWHDCQPIVNVTWDDAARYCEWLSKRSGRTFRLPTEAEWEFAARGGIESRGYMYSGSNDVGEAGFYKSNSPTQTQPVGGKLPNELGLYDMSGNVWEWCSDWYDDKYSAKDAVINPGGIAEGRYRVIRGGGWVAPAGDLRITNRWKSDPALPANHLGFRPVVEP